VPQSESFTSLAALPLISTKEAAKRVGISTRTLYRYTEHNRIPFIKLDGVLRFEPNDIERFIERRKVRAA